ncbi:MAG: tryptophan 2,3-dioxygenase [Cryobacterium sp.]|nr:tryptophan 2,3-dioxygenase [Oligoflexia bacterium]
MTTSPSTYGKSDLSYNDYLRVPELIALQKPLSTPEHHDEMLFIIIHQAYELWFKLIIHELEAAMESMAKREVLRAQHFVKRVVEIQRVLVQQIHILETMTPVEFLQFRENLMPASGFQSLQHREIEFMCGMKDERYFRFFANRPEVVARLRSRFDGPDLAQSFLTLTRALGYPVPEKDTPETHDEVLQALKGIYQNPSNDLPLYLLAESLVDLDQGLSLWREHHVRVVERVIGFRKGTGGSSGAEYLRAETAKKAFPFLWEIRTLLEKA